MAGCGGLWRDVVEENGIKLEEKGEKNGTKYPIFAVPFPPFFRRSKIFPTVPFVKISTALTDGKRAIFATHRHSPTRRPVRVLGVMTWVREWVDLEVLRTAPPPLLVAIAPFSFGDRSSNPFPGVGAA